MAEQGRLKNKTNGKSPERLHFKITWDKSVVVGFEVFTEVVLKSIIFWDMTPCSL
jgi:hypothetical protein